MKPCGGMQGKKRLWAVRVRHDVGDLEPLLASVSPRKLAQYVYRLLRHGHADVGEAQYEARFRRSQPYELIETARTLGFTLIAAKRASADALTNLRAG